MHAWPGTSSIFQLLGLQLPESGDQGSLIVQCRFHQDPRFQKGQRCAGLGGVQSARPQYPDTPEVLGETAANRDERLGLTVCKVAVVEDEDAIGRKLVGNVLIEVWEVLVKKLQALENNAPKCVGKMRGYGFWENDNPRI
eukprot:TRINITY_DN81662_c0_g1_i1.p2 TRINITY_DN81662_c0_g1~~TRINITY_DN81662_c0_g1_i1.p2  ORF type:complete len:140 (+),score=14.24 TRINITY_DN81662_c0_g1_i1:20-439(+)